MKFTKIHLETWPRREAFYYFSKMCPTGYSLTVPIDITHMYQFLKEKNLKFFPAYLWLITKNLNQQIEFKLAMQEETLGYYDTLTPLYAAFHEDDRTISFQWTDYQDKFSFFYQNYIENQKQNANHHGILGQNGTPPKNAYTVSCLPWINFKHFCVHSYENKDYYFPSIESGKFYQKGNHTYMPLSITCHHAATDGYHVKKFLGTLQSDMNMLEKYCDKKE